MSSVEDRTRAGSLDQATLLKDLQRQVVLLQEDLRERTESVQEYATALHAEYDRALASERTGSPYETWRDDRVVQIAAAWVLACVFVRFSEDNGLVPDAWLSGPGERLAEAQDRHDDFFRRSPELNDRDWLTESFDALGAAHTTAAGLFDRRHNPLWEVTPSYEAATRLLAFWRERGADGEVRYDFSDPELNTRFLGDLYQDLSEHARKTYALLQTPVFVEEFILDLTLDPAIEEFGLDPVWKHKPDGWHGELTDGEVRGLRCIDPACGSGHFLLGMFERVLARWRELEPGTDDWVLIRRALESVHGADKNPFAASIARFRLLVAALKECGVRELRGAPEMPIRVAVGDSLLHGRGAEGVTESLFADETFYYRTEDAEDYARDVDLLGKGTYHVVVANPPYITVKDKQENANYKAAYDACYRQYALSVPFAQRIFELAVRAGGGERTGGFTGQITANSFMKREFGKKLIEEFFPRVDLTHVIDTSGAFIPGHGTPTVILAGRNQNQLQADKVRAVLSVRGEPGQPDDAALGLVWQAIVKQVGRTGSESDWVSVEDLRRGRLATHPWSLSGGGAGPVMERLSRAASGRLGTVVDSIGFGAVTREDDAYVLGSSVWLADQVGKENLRPIIGGTSLRDWSSDGGVNALFPYGDERQAWVSECAERTLWPNRTLLKLRRALSGTQEEQGLSWYEYSSFSRARIWAPRLIGFAFVATLNHFTMHRGGTVPVRSAPVIKLPEGASEERHLELLGVLNSSAACFWLKQVSHDKGLRGEGGGFTSDDWERFYEFTGTKLQQFPLPAKLPLRLGSQLDTLARSIAEHEPSALAGGMVPARTALDEACAVQDGLRTRMIASQEELDWAVYGAYGLLTATEVARTTLPGEPVDLPRVDLGQRAFEIALARRVRDEGEATTWFERHRSTPTTEIPAEWPDAYKKVVQARLDLIESNKDIRLIERPEYKRRWSTDPWEKREEAALRTWLLDAAERKDLWFEERDEFTAPRPLTVSQLADALRHDEDVQSVAALYAADHLGKRDASLATVLAAVIEPEHVPYLSVLRYKETGLRKRAQWEQVWEQQREEDRTGQRLDIAVPPKYSGADFLKVSYWSNRGKLDVPKERFISYPDASTDNDQSLLLGWAGWNHREQAEALANLVHDRVEKDGWPKDDPRFVPLLAGLQEAMPWVHQWYDEFDAEWDGNPAEEFQSALNLGRTERHLSESDLRAWRPEKKRGGRKRAEVR
ncbi:BREX-2 system adenine-specific DNA-methyltransferase PglX [Streptomyces sp. NBC_01500]|uniref:BREX-2 system adenine-specific DNA-methyltransferase PglX n=1 Tax=Streptomyces sp. NBC_01500 TaxID=2903886 RepID=UPI00225B1FFC|nr:BREX-2 system adenine-specific DNA-methyltransferase PglX [Streptomyces sp. NBC_01500]MCX4550372.1 BREX-2 system adenine-specific DNA-methyltransferase PglX [Streptomyces sp. NBC_01500]